MTRRRIRNLTAMFYSAPDTPPRYVSDVFTAELLSQVIGTPFEIGAAERDIVYIVVAGYGGLDGTDLTAGDVVHVPAGATRNFTALSRRFCTWRLTLSRGSPPNHAAAKLPSLVEA